MVVAAGGGVLGKALTGTGPLAWGPRPLDHPAAGARRDGPRPGPSVCLSLFLPPAGRLRRRRGSPSRGRPGASSSSAAHARPRPERPPVRRR